MTALTKICVGTIQGAHGIKGLVRVRSFMEQPEDLFMHNPISNEDGSRSFMLKPVGVQKDHFLVRIDGCDDRTAAEALRGVTLFIARDALPPVDDGTYYERDLIGLDVRDHETGASLGSILAVHDYGAGTFLEIKPQNAASFMLPFRDAFVPDVDIAGGFVTAVLPPDWLRNDRPPADADDAS